MSRREHAARADDRAQPRWSSCVLLVVWAALAHVDEVTRGDGKVIPSRQLQVVQSLDGGVVSEILVKEGQVVEAGQLLLQIDETRATSGVRESAAQGFALRARQARLRALAEGSPFQPPRRPSNAGRAAHPGRGAPPLRGQALRAVHDARRSTSSSSQQRQQELHEMRARASAAPALARARQQELAQDAAAARLAARCPRSTSCAWSARCRKSRGDFEQAGAQIARVQASIGEAQRKIQETELTFRNEARREMAEVSGKLNALNEGAVALADKVDKAQVKSPVRGRVQRLLANTVGGVVQPGKDIVEIVPLDDSLVLEARIAPKDIAFIRPGQSAIVKFSAYDFSIYGGLDAKVENISPDTTVDERGNAFYLVRVRTTKPGFSEKLPIIPGMTAEVDVLTGNKSVLSYLLKPVLKIQALRAARTLKTRAPPVHGGGLSIKKTIVR